MQSSNHALAPFEGEGANDDDHAFTPSGVRTRVAPRPVPEGSRLLPRRPDRSLAQRALEALAVADDLRDEEPTTEWLAQWPSVRSWDASHGRRPVAPPPLPPSTQDNTVELTAADLSDRRQPPPNTEFLAARWMLQEHQATPVPAEDYVSVWVGGPASDMPMARSTPAPWSLATWVMVAAAVLGGELIVMVALLL